MVAMYIQLYEMNSKEKTTFHCMGCHKERPIEDKIYIHGIKTPKCRSCVVNMVQNKTSSIHNKKSSI